MIEIIEMQPFHVPWIAELEKICFHDPWSERSIASELENPLSHWLVAMDGEKLVGYVGSQTVLGETDMMNVAVCPDYRRQGIAEGLILALIADLKARESHCLTWRSGIPTPPPGLCMKSWAFRKSGGEKITIATPKKMR